MVMHSIGPISDTNMKREQVSESKEEQKIFLGKKNKEEEDGKLMKYQITKITLIAEYFTF